MPCFALSSRHLSVDQPNDLGGGAGLAQAAVGLPPVATGLSASVFKPGLDIDAKKANDFFKFARDKQTNPLYAFTNWIMGFRCDPTRVPELKEALILSERIKDISTASKKLSEIVASEKHPANNYLSALVKYALAPKDPNTITAVINAASALNLSEVAKFLCEMGLATFEQGGVKPKKRDYLVIADAFEKFEAFKRAEFAARKALALETKKDYDLEGRILDLSTKATIQQGNYEKDGGFQASVRDPDAQARLQRDERLVVDERTGDERVKEAALAYAGNPLDKGLVLAYVKLLKQRGKDSDFKTARNVLDRAWRESQDNNDRNAFAHELRILDVAVQEKVVATLRTNREDSEAGQQLLRQELIKLHELKVDCAKFAAELRNEKDSVLAYGRELFFLGELKGDPKLIREAIVQLQHIALDSAVKVEAKRFIGKSFALLGFIDEANIAFEEAFEASQDHKTEIRFDWAKSLANIARRDYNLELALQAREHISHVLVVQVDLAGATKLRDTIHKLIQEIKNPKTS